MEEENIWGETLVQQRALREIRKKKGQIKFISERTEVERVREKKKKRKKNKVFFVRSLRLTSSYYDMFDMWTEERTCCICSSMGTRPCTQQPGMATQVSPASWSAPSASSTCPTRSAQERFAHSPALTWTVAVQSVTEWEKKKKSACMARSFIKVNMSKNCTFSPTE